MAVPASATFPILSATPCYLNGEFSTLKDAKVSVLNRGFIFGDGVHEVVPAYNGKLSGFAQHMARLNRNHAELRIANPLASEQWRDIAHKLIAPYAHGTGDNKEKSNQLIYIQLTRGGAQRDHSMLPGLSPTVFVMVNSLTLPDAQQRKQGVACVSADDFRWEKAQIKCTSLLGAVFARQISVDAGAVETVMFRGDALSEAAASNVWVVRDGKVSRPTSCCCHQRTRKSCPPRCSTVRRSEPENPAPSIRSCTPITS